MFPNLDHDVDLTQNPNGLDGLVQAPAPTTSLDEDPPPTGQINVPGPQDPRP